MKHEEVIAQIREFAWSLFYNGHLDAILNVQMNGHKKTKVEHEGKSAEVDDALVPLIRSLWQQGCDTVCSCQDLTGSGSSDASAYVQFPSAEADANRFSDSILAAGLRCVCEPHDLVVPLGGGLSITYRTIIVRFASGTIPEVTRVVEAGLVGNR